MENTVFIIHQLYLFLSVHCWLRAVGTRTPQPCGSAHRPASSVLGGQPPRPPPHPTVPQIFALVRGSSSTRSDHPGLGGGRGLQVSSWRSCDAGRASRGLDPSRKALPPPLSHSGKLGAASTQTGEAEVGSRLTLWKWRRPARATGPGSAPRALPGARQTPRGRAGRGLTFAGNPAGRDGGSDRLGPPHSTRFARVAPAPPPPPPPWRVGSIPFVRIYGERLQ